MTIRMPWGLLVGCGLVAAVTIVFARVVAFEFVVFDDDINIVFNPHLGGFDAESWRWLWSDFTYMRRYLPLSWLAFFGLFAAGGLDPSVYHAANVILHALNAVLVFGACAQLLALRAPAAPAVERIALAGLAAAFWACHPLRVEPVAGASGLLYLLSAGGAVASWIIFVHAETVSPRLIWRGASVLAFTASALAYPIGLGLPCVMLAWLWGRRVAEQRRISLWPVMPHVAIAAATLMLAVCARWSGEVTTTGAEPMLSVPARLGRAAYVWIYYWWRPFWPTGLSPVYDTFLGQSTGRNLHLWSVLLVAAVTVLAIILRRRLPWLLPLWVGYMASMLPHTGLLERAFFPADRYSYLVGVWQVLLGASIIQAWAGRRVPARRWPLGVGAVACAVVACGARVQTAVWQNSATLFARIDEAVSLPGVKAAYRMRYATVLAAQGDLAGARRMEAAAEQAAPGFDLGAPRKIVNELVRLSETAGVPAFAGQHYELGLARQRRGDLFGARVHFAGAVALAPHYHAARYNLALALAASGTPRDALAQFFALDARTLSARQRQGFWMTLAESFRARGLPRLAESADARVRND